MVEFKNISFSYSKDSGVYDIDLKVDDNEFCFIVFHKIKNKVN